MAHSVAQHLAVSPEHYDVEIRRLIPSYDTMLDELSDGVAEHVRPDAHVLDLGCGTGRAAAHVAARLTGARFTLLDADAAMLSVAETRFASLPVQASFRQGSFTLPLPPCDAAIASLSLHHVHDAIDKRALYRNIAESVATSGVLVVADAMMPESGPLAETIRKRWAQHLVTGGDTLEQAYARFNDWAQEDRYFPVDEELSAIKAAGFTAVDVRWRSGPIAVIVAIK